MSDPLVTHEDSNVVSGTHPCTSTGHQGALSWPADHLYGLSLLLSSTNSQPGFIIILASTYMSNSAMETSYSRLFSG